MGAPKQSWDDRLRAVEQQFPSASSMNAWRGEMEDVAVMGRLISSVLKVDSTPAGLRGEKPALDFTVGMARLRQLWGEDYSSRPFAEAFQILAGGRSVVELAEMSGIPAQRVRRLQSGLAKPTGLEMEGAAAAFGKPAIYWAEYRIGLILMAVADYLEKRPDTSAGLVGQLAPAP